VLPAIQFYNHPLLKADEINDVRPHRLLSAKLVSRQLVRTQPPP